jgi:flagellin-like protein
MKGISAIIASVLLIAFTVAVGGILSVWSTTLTTTQTQTVGNQTGGQIVCSPALIIDEARATTNVGLNITYHNAGNQVITNVKVWARNTTGGISSTPTSNLASGEMNLTAVIISGTIDLARVTGTCANVVAVSAECTPADRCWKS